MKKNLIRSLFLILLILLISGCKKMSHKSKYFSSAYVEDIYSFNENYFGVISEYSSGLLSEADPLIVRFNSGVKLTKQEGESLSSSIFKIYPKLKGEPYWIDSNTIGYRLKDKPKFNETYVVSFDLSQFIDQPKEFNTFDYKIVFQPQSFTVEDVIYSSEEDNQCNYSLKLKFVHNINAEDVPDMLNDDIKEKYICNAQSLDEKNVLLTISGIERKASDYDIKFILNGKNIGVAQKLNQTITVYNNKKFNFIDYKYNSENRSISVRFTNKLNPKQNLEGFLNNNNKYIEYSTECVDNMINIYFDEDFEVRSDDFYLTLNPPIKDHNNDSYSEKIEMKINPVITYKPGIRWLDEGNIIPGQSDAKLLFQAKNLNSVIVRFVKVYDNNVVNFLNSNSLSNTYGIRKVGRLVKKIEMKLEADDITKYNTFPIEINKYIDVKQGDLFQVILDYNITGFVHASPEAIQEYDNSYINEDDYWDGKIYDFKRHYYGDDYWEYYDDPQHLVFYNNVEIKKNILISDLSLSVKSSGDNSFDIFTRYISDASIASGVNIAAYNYQMQPIIKASTDKTGYVGLKCDQSPNVIEAVDSYGNKAFIVLNENSSLSLSKFDVSGVDVEGNLNGFIYSNRNVWLPGDSVTLFLMLSDRNKIIPDNLPVIMEIVDSQGRLYSKLINNDPVGNIYSFKFKTEPSDVTGVWYAYAKLGNYSFSKALRIETIKPNRLKIDMSIPNMLSLNSSNFITLSAEWLSGMNAGALKSSVNVNFQKLNISFPKFKGYVFDNITDNTLYEQNNGMTLFEGNLDGAGRKSISTSPLKELNAKGMYNINMIVKVFEKGGDFSISSFKTKVSPFNRYIGVMYPNGANDYYSYFNTDKNCKFDVVLVNENGEYCKENTSLNLKLYKISEYWWWGADSYELGKYAKGTYSTPFKEMVLNTVDGKADFSLKIGKKHKGSYLLVINDEQGGYVFSDVIKFFSSYSDSYSSVSDAPVILKLESDKDNYEVGEDIIVKFPASKKSKARVTVEAGSGILQTIELDNLKSENEVKIKTTSDMVPNVYVSVSLYQPFEDARDLPVRLYGILPVTVQDSKLVLKPVIKMPEKSESNNNIDISVSEINGNEMYYTVALVDEGILGLTNYKTADPLRHFNAKQALKIRTWDNYSDIIDVFTGELSSVYAIGGDDMGVLNQESMLLKRFSSVAYAIGPFELKKGESNTHTLNIPEYMGNLRAMVVASNTKGSFGSAQANIKVKDPLMIIPAVPKIVSPKDEFVIPVQIFSDLKNSNVSVNINTTNLDVLSSSEQNIKLDDEGSAICEFNVKVPEVSQNASIKISAKAGSYSKDYKVDVPLRIPFSYRYEKMVKELAAGKTFSDDFKVFGIRGTNKANVSVNSFLPVDMTKRLSELSFYLGGSLGCNVSKGFSLLYYDVVTDLTDIDLKEIKSTINVALKNINLYRSSNGILTNWPSGDVYSPWMEVYALHFMVEADKLGYEVNEELKKDVLNRQIKLASAWKENPEYKTGSIIQAYRLFVLAQADKANIGAMNRLRDSKNLLPLSKAFLGAAYGVKGKKSIAQKILSEIDYKDEKISIYDINNLTYGSYLRDYSILTYTEMLTNKNNDVVRPMIEKIGEEISSNYWMSDQTISFALFTLCKYAEMNKVKNADINVNIDVNGKSNNITSNKPMITHSFELADDNVLAVTNNSSMPVYVTVMKEGAVPEYTVTESGSGCKLSVNYFNKSGEKISPASLMVNTDFYAELTLEPEDNYQNLYDMVLTYMLPAGWEIINEDFFGGDDKNYCNYVDYRHDRVVFYFDMYYNKKKTFKVNLNAVYKGKFVVPQIECRSMYDNNINYTLPAMPVRVN